MPKSGKSKVKATFARVATHRRNLRRNGMKRVEVRVASRNPEGQAFWRALGFGDLMDVLHRRL